MVKFKHLAIAALFILSATVIKAQEADLTDFRVFINPGHGGYDSDDRHMLATDFWESEGNLEKGLFLRSLLINLNASVFMSRTTNNTSDDLLLSAITTMANSANVDFFLAIHSNGFDGKQNQPLMLFRGYDNQPAYPVAKTMALILWQKLFEKGNCWTNENLWVKGDLSFYPEWGTQGLGVLRGLNVPGVLSEGSFHDYIPESWRLRNKDFLHHESWAFVRSFLEYDNSAPLQHGIIAGVIRDTLKSPSWYFKPGTKDEALPLNNGTVTLQPGNKKYYVDDLNNGFFIFDSLPSGDYKLYFEGVQDYMDDSLVVTVASGKSALVDFGMQFDTTIVPRLTEILPDLVDSLPFNQEFTFSFSLPMDRDSVQKALVFIPSADLVYEWNDKGTILTISPSVSFIGKTTYTFRLTTTACSVWKVPIEEEIIKSFVTRNRSRLNLLQSFPAKDITGVTLYPQVRLLFDAPLNQGSAQTEIKLLNDQGLALTKISEEFHESDGKGWYFFEPAQPLDLNRQYALRISGTLTDITGTTFGNDSNINFTTRTSGYGTGTTVEDYDDLSVFWDPEASGSTTGTDNPRTTFTSSTLIKRSGVSAGRLDYVFTNPAGGVCRVFDTRKPVIGQNPANIFGIWVFGDISMNILEYWFYSAGTTNQIVYTETIDWAGWDLKTIPLSLIGGTGDKQFHSVVVRQTETGSKSGTLWFDDAMLIVPTGIDDHNGSDISLSVFPNPVTAEATVTFTVTERSSVSLDVFALDGRKTGQIMHGLLEPGVKTIRWVPSDLIADGVYLIRMESRTDSEGPPVTKTIKCILTRHQ
ncbi:MAG TPA: Ig-like domain-containing protein [Bacteroidales bacterium]|nr:Ig-like domain-containing protein [Bacteroidales bacterium]